MGGKLMNVVAFLGRLTKDPEVRYTDSNMCIARFTLAVDRIGKDKGADFPRCVAFGKTAEVIERYIKKGSQIAVSGHLQTGSYEKDGQTVYTTDVIVDRMDFAGTSKQSDQAEADAPTPQIDMSGFAAMDDDIPF
jgi:single-strand DNA-binding protein